MKKESRNVKMTYENEMFICKTDFDSRHIPKEAGFNFDKSLKAFTTADITRAARLGDYGDEKAKLILSKNSILVTPWTGVIPFPASIGKKPFPFQIERAVPFALTRNKSYLALRPGLGKTICAALYLNAKNHTSQNRHRAIYICPPFLVSSVEEKIKEWSTWSPKIITMHSKFEPQDFDILLIPDSLLRFESNKKIKTPILKMSEMFLKHVSNTTLIVDEAHRFKNDSQRSKALYRFFTKIFDRIILMSGSPMPNRPLELFKVLSHCAPETIDHMTSFQYGMRFCNGFEGPWGWDFKGSSNMPELMDRVHKNFMLTIHKEDVLPELPPKIEEVITLGELPKSARIDDQKVRALIATDEDEETELKNQIKEDEGLTDLHVATYRRIVGELKVGAAVKFIKEILEDSDEAVLIFAIHSSVVLRLKEGLSEYDPLIIVGETPMATRDARRIMFQDDKSRRVMILNITAGGIGLDLQKASRVIFVEFSWVPEDNGQAADRAHRIGQKRSVFVQYLVYSNSVDEAVLRSNLRKKQITKLF